MSSGHPTQVNRQDYHLSDSVHWVIGSHEIAFGGDFLKEDVDLINTYRQNAQYTFATTNYSGNALSDFMLGYAQKFVQGGGEYSQRRANLGSLFMQDNYRATRNLVLNLGLRWDPSRAVLRYPGTNRVFLAWAAVAEIPEFPAGL